MIIFSRGPAFICFVLFIGTVSTGVHNSPLDGSYLQVEAPKEQDKRQEQEEDQTGSHLCPPSS